MRICISPGHATSLCKGDPEKEFIGTSRLDILPINVVHPSGFNYLSVVVPEGSRVLYNYSSYNSISIPYEVDEV